MTRKHLTMILTLFIVIGLSFHFIEFRLFNNIDVTNRNCLSVNESTNTRVTPVGGDIRNDTIWSKGNSPFLVVDDVKIYDATLTIEAGVEVRFGGYYDISIVGGSNFISKRIVNEPIIENFEKHRI